MKQFFLGLYYSLKLSKSPHKSYMMCWKNPLSTYLHKRINRDLNQHLRSHINFQLVNKPQRKLFQAEKPGAIFITLYAQKQASEIPGGKTMMKTLSHRMPD